MDNKKAVLVGETKHGLSKIQHGYFSIKAAIYRLARLFYSWGRYA